MRRSICASASRRPAAVADSAPGRRRRRRRPDRATTRGRATAGASTATNSPEEERRHRQTTRRGRGAATGAPDLLPSGRRRPTPPGGQPFAFDSRQAVVSSPGRRPGERRERPSHRGDRQPMPACSRPHLVERPTRRTVTAALRNGTGGAHQQRRSPRRRRRSRTTCVPFPATEVIRLAAQARPPPRRRRPDAMTRTCEARRGSSPGRNTSATISPLVERPASAREHPASTARAMTRRDRCDRRREVIHPRPGRAAIERADRDLPPLAPAGGSTP
jgi:hypothetical protein